MTISLDNKGKIIRDFRGKYNMQPDGKKSMRKHHQMESSYLYLLRKAAKIMGRWMERGQLRHR